MVEAASRLFQACGYRGTSWRQLVRESGTPWGSIQHHFPGGKEELGIAAVEYGADLLRAFLESCFATDASPADAVRTWFEGSAGLLEAQDFRFGCAVAAVTLDTDDETGALRDACAKAFESWERILKEGLIRGGYPEGEAASLATTCIAAFEGALLLARARASSEPLRQTAATLAVLLERTRPSRSGGRPISRT